MKKIIFILALFGLLNLTAFAEESITITTYYPSPYGSYNELTAYRMKIGTTYSGVGTTVSDNNLIVEGNVGIGTTNPGTFRLYVDGNMYVTGPLQVDGDITKGAGSPYAYPDYVFESGYDLLSLAGLKNFIAKNKHLPNMPSSQVVKKEGVKIFEQNRLLLEKLEEAYLYIINLEERIAKLEKVSK